MIDKRLYPVGPHKRLRPLSAEHRGNLYRCLRNHQAASADPTLPVVGMEGEPIVEPINAARAVSIAAWVLMAGILALGYFARNPG